MCTLCGADIIKYIAYFCSLIKGLKYVLHAPPHTSIRYDRFGYKRYSIMVVFIFMTIDVWKGPALL